MKRYIEIFGKIKGKNEILSFGLYKTEEEFYDKVTKLLKEGKIDPVSEKEIVIKKFIWID